MKIYTTSCSTRCTPLTIERILRQRVVSLHANECSGGKLKEKVNTIARFENVTSCGVERTAVGSYCKRGLVGLRAFAGRVNSGGTILS